VRIESLDVPVTAAIRFPTPMMQARRIPPSVEQGVQVTRHHIQLVNIDWCAATREAWARFVNTSLPHNSTHDDTHANQCNTVRNPTSTTISVGLVSTPDTHANQCNTVRNPTSTTISVGLVSTPLRYRATHPLPQHPTPSIPQPHRHPLNTNPTSHTASVSHLTSVTRIPTHCGCGLVCGGAAA
jgi:hypothetical protein